MENDVEAAHREANKENDPADYVAEFPKMLYLHPVDKAKEHKFIVVNTQDEADQATEKGYKEEPHIPTPPESLEYEGDGTKQPTDNADVTAHKQDSPGDVIEFQKVEQKPTEHKEQVDE